MLQQTTVQAVVPFYERFMERFPTVSDLANAPLEEVLEAWAGLGYYTRARNLHRSAQSLSSEGFPRTAAELLELPGFGPYTSRAVASLAFGEAVGVLDGNVIRVLSRLTNSRAQWWKTAGRLGLQKMSDQLCQLEAPEIINQGLMELGATVCTPDNPACLLCPWVSSCEARKKGTMDKLPLSKPRRDTEIWIWEPQIIWKNKKLALVENDYAPFLKGQLIPPGRVKKADEKPAKFDAKHTITHHQIYIKKQKTLKAKTQGKIHWVDLKELRKKNPSSLLQKALAFCFCLIAITQLFGCKTADKNIKPAPIQVTVPASSPAQEVSFGSRLTSGGENFHARFSRDGQSLIYVSKGRLSQKNQQIYSMSISDQKEKRITYSDGESDMPMYVNGDYQFAYVSDTDSAKENPRLFSEPGTAPHTNDLFLSDISGFPIEKLTHFNNVFSSIDFDGDKNFIYTVNRKLDHRVGLVSEKGEHPPLLFQSEDKELVFGLRNRHQLNIWLEEDQIAPAVLKMKRPNEKIKDVFLPFFSIHDLSWWDPERETILVSGKLPKDSFDAIYLYDLRFNCMIQVAKVPTDLWYPSVNSEKSLLALTIIDHGLRQIYLSSLPQDLGQCSPASPDIEAPKAN